jgi:hypothetical protein
LNQDVEDGAPAATPSTRATRNARPMVTETPRATIAANARQMVTETPRATIAGPGGANTRAVGQWPMVAATPIGGNARVPKIGEMVYSQNGTANFESECICKMFSLHMLTPYAN